MTQEEQKAIFSKNLKHYMSLAGKQQIDVAKDLQIKATTLNSWCKGVSIPEPSKIRKFADYFGIYFTDLVDEKLNSDEDKLFGELISEIIKKDVRFKKIIVNYSKLPADKQNLICEFFEKFIF